MHMKNEVAVVLCTSAVTIQGRTEPRKESKIFTLVKSKGKVLQVLLWDMEMKTKVKITASF